jgi:hypothetical protein
LSEAELLESTWLPACAARFGSSRQDAKIQEVAKILLAISASLREPLAADFWEEFQRQDTSKTGAAVRMQAPVATANLIALMEGKAPWERYNGYTACPFVTQYGKALMAEFGYDKKSAPAIPLIDPGREHWIGCMLKVHVLKPLCFDGMLKGLV